jgi:hypothetical protein
MLQDWKQSELCKNLCLQEQEKYNQLYIKGYQLFQNVDRIISEAKAKAVSNEFSVKGNMHRGVYCPSPVLDLLVGGLSKGRILKRVTATSKVTHKYSFDEYSQLLYVESMILDGCTEYLVREGTSIWGITVDCEGNLSAISEESFFEGHLQRYTYAEIVSDEEHTDCYQMCSEEYRYDNQGLFSCLRTEYIPMYNDISKRKLYTFERRNGYLHSYTAVNQIWEQIDPLGTKTTTCTPTIKRKA